ncbi:cytochrome P450/flavodoxin [Leucobacter exalbidus]|uniref:Cytochrome P450/flavodoxin n=1 Tax=Leucobacter exalbidus TaxID=662960 RepID=A0A940PMQ8_9MICO|nr:cytochrome P450 [Leucobacter exalbidus]MBP1326797.1 cytochrome P450/flavodoxin [Leucobacter exalbidus]
MASKEAPVADWVTIADLHRDPFPIYERLRAEGGVHWVPAVGRYLVTSYAAVHETELDQQIFSADEEGSLQIRAMGHSMLRRDDPEHYIERRAWQPMLRPSAVKRIWKSTFQRNAEHYLEELIKKGSGADLVWDFAAPYAAESLREIIGLHNATQQDLQRWSQTMIDATGNYADDPEVWALGKQSFDEVDVALDEMLQWHAQNPNDSLLSHLLQIPDYKMPIESIRANVKMTIGGGLNEPRDALGVAAWALLQNPDQLASVESDPSLWGATFDETIRWVAPIGLYSRQVKQDTVLAGVKLPAGARLGICILSANRDEDVWDDAADFNIHREVKPHLAFGKGVHVCLGAWVARSEIADVALPLLFSSLEGLALIDDQPAEIGGWVFRGMTKLPVTWTGRRTAARAQTGAQGAGVAAGVGSSAGSGAAAAGEPAAAAPRVAIVGSGPAGSFTAQALRRTFPGAPIEVFDEMPTPYGLVRYGVAADHQGTKAVARQFDRLFTEEGVVFRGNSKLGVDFSLDELRRNYDAVVLATGVHGDAQLSVPGAQLAGVRGAGAVTRYLNGHPDEAAPEPLGSDVLVVGHGNVAMDVVRLLVRDADGLRGSDLDDDAHGRFVGAVRTVRVVGRSAPHEAKFDPVMVRELAGLRGVEHVVHGAGELAADGRDARVDAVRALIDAGAAAAQLAALGTPPRVRVEWWFGVSPQAFTGAERVEAAVLSSAAGDITLPATDVITAVGFTADAGSPVAPGAHPDGRIEPGLYVAGWLRRGPRGTIPDQRADARDLARLIAADVQAGTGVAGTKPAAGAQGLVPLEGTVDFDGWRRIDQLERAAAAPNRERSKLLTREAQLAAATDLSIALPVLAAGGAESIGAGVPTTILFGTESGGAELVADELSRMFGEDADVEVQDLADTTVTELDVSRMHLVVCSTYGDGEVPTSVIPFYEALETMRPELAGVRYAMFGMGDRSYDRTYSRGSELVDEALQGCGAVRVGEYGRHDAGGSIAAADAARDWAAGVFAEVLASAASL